MKLKKTALCMAILLSFVTIGSSLAQGDTKAADPKTTKGADKPEGKEATTKAKKAKLDPKNRPAKLGTRAAAEALKEVAPPSRGGPKDRAGRAWCGVRLDNATGYYVDCYIDNVYRGTLSPWSYMYRDVQSGNTSIYLEGGGWSWSWTYYLPAGSTTIFTAS